MKSLLIVRYALVVSILAFCLIQNTFCQAPYLGGNGDGYHMAATTFHVGNEPWIQEYIQIFPVPCTRGNTVHVLALHVQYKLQVLLRDEIGQDVLQETMWNVLGEGRIDVSTKSLTSGLYFLEVRRDGHSETRKIIVLEE